MLIEQSGPSLRVALPADGMLSVIDMAGHVVINHVVTQGTTEVSTASLAAGVYLVQLSTPAGIQTAKVVVKWRAAGDSHTDDYLGMQIGLILPDCPILQIKNKPYVWLLNGASIGLGIL